MCKHPLKGFPIGIWPDSGKPKYKIVSYNTDFVRFDGDYWHALQGVPFGDYVSEFIEIPCGQCIECRLQYARDWANRCMLEAQYHDENWFLTLTYDDDHLPDRHELVNCDTGEIVPSPIVSLNKDELSSFMKRLRKNTGQTDFFSFYFFRRANGYLLLNFRKVELRDGMVLLLSPHQQQEWHVNEVELDYTFLIFREDFMRTFIADKFFVYRLLYYYQTDTPPYLFAEPEELTEYMRLLKKIKQELQHPVVDTYNLIVSVLYYLLVIINRAYAQTYRLPVEVPKNNYAFKFKDLLEKHIRTTQRVQEYADMLRVSRITLNNSVMAQFGVSAIHLLKQRLLEELKNELLFSNLNVSQLADEFHFSDPSHLMRFFKKETGKTFTQYLMNYKRGIYE